MGRRIAETGYYHTQQRTLDPLCLLADESVGRVQARLREASVRSHYGNYPDLAFGDWAAAYYGEAGYERLRRVKREYDPDNLFRHPQSVRP